MEVFTLQTKDQVKMWLERCVMHGETTIALDLETTGLTRRDTIISGAMTGIADQVAFFGKDLVPALLQAPEEIEFVFHNSSFDLKMLSWHGVRLQDNHNYHDTMILAHLNDENQELGLGALVFKHYGDNYKETFWSRFKKAEDADEKSLKEYNAKDCLYTLRLFRLLKEKIEKEGIPLSLVDHVYLLQESLLETEIQGIKIDREYLMQKGIELKTKISELLPKMRSMVEAEIDLIETEDWIKELDKRKTPKGKAGVKKPEFSFDSAKQLMRLLYDKLKLPEQKNEKSKQPTCDWDALERIKEQHAIIPLIQEYREAHKIYGTYIEGILERMVDGRIYPSFNVTGTATGRISHQNPNMGNLPSSGGIRGMFIPDEGCVFIAADFSQLEVCLSAHFTRDENLLKIINEGASQHDITAKALGIERSKAKTLNFAMQYGCTHYKVMKVLGVTETEGKKAYDKYWEAYKGQKAKMDECRFLVDAGQPIVNPFGRRRRFEVKQRKPHDSAYRQSWNALVQGTGSDCTSRALYLTDIELRKRGYGRALFSVHDEIICEVKKEHAEEGQKILIECMESVGKEIDLSVELKAEGSGPMERWLD